MSIGVKLLRMLGQIGLISCMVMMVFTPLRFGTPGFVIGLLVYAAGYVMVMSSLNTFRTASAGRSVVSGFYRWSRNPQWVGLAMVLFGPALMTGVLLYMGIIISVAVIYHLQIVGEEKLCLKHYGDSYQAYVANVPRYLLFF
ncbi:MAG: methyltransferase [Anaerolineales bacterium]